MSKIKCAWCNRLTSNPTMHVPPSEVTALEPSEPVPLCRVCASETDLSKAEQLYLEETEDSTNAYGVYKKHWVSPDYPVHSNWIRTSISRNSPTFYVNRNGFLDGTAFVRRDDKDKFICVRVNGTEKRCGWDDNYIATMPGITKITKQEALKLLQK